MPAAQDGRRRDPRRAMLSERLKSMSFRTSIDFSHTEAVSTIFFSNIQLFAGIETLKIFQNFKKNILKAEIIEYVKTLHSSVKYFGYK